VLGRVSTEVEAHRSFDIAGTVARAHRMLKDYDDASVDRSRMLVRIASTWEGILATRQLAEEGVKCKLTLLFSLRLGVACAAAKVQLISSFVGRIYDWFKKTAGGGWNEAANTGTNAPGLKSVAQIYSCDKQHGIQTEVVGASFRNTGQIVALAGCDLVTISQSLLAELAASDVPVQQALDARAPMQAPLERLRLEESAFRFALDQDAMATENLAEGIRQFVAGAIALERLIDDIRAGGRSAERRYRHPRRQRHPHARRRCGAAGELRPPRHADGPGRHRRCAADPLSAPRPGQPAVAQPRPLRVVQRARVDAALRPTTPDERGEARCWSDARVAAGTID
jgi:transaldolase